MSPKRSAASTQTSLGSDARHRGLLLSVGILSLLLAITRPAFADVPAAFVFFAFVFSIAPFTPWWATVIGIAFEAFCVWRFLGLNWYRSVGGALVAKIASTLLGAVPVMSLGWATELLLRDAMSGYDPRTQELVGFSIAQILLPAINAAIELPILYAFGVRLEWRSAMIVYAANFASVALLIWPLLVQ